MLALDEIKRLSTKLQTTELNVRREFVQHQFLRFFYQQLLASKVYFKGGTALRIVYHSPRFSEDLDFDSQLDFPNLENIVESTLELLGKDGIESEIIESKMTGGGYLGIIELDGLKTSLEISNRKRSSGEPITIVGDFTAPYTLFSLERASLVSEKIEALLSRQKPRDFYDLYFMLRARLLTQEDKNQLSKVKTVVISTEINFEKELKIFLPKSHWATISDFKKVLLMAINDYL